MTNAKVYQRFHDEKKLKSTDLRYLVYSPAFEVLS